MSFGQKKRRCLAAPPVLSSGQGSVVGVFAILLAVTAIFAAVFILGTTVLFAPLLIIFGQRDVHHFAIGGIDGDGFLAAVG